MLFIVFKNLVDNLKKTIAIEIHINFIGIYYFYI
jgi:hypothetical protein